jgi:hypothetical protein
MSYTAPPPNTDPKENNYPKRVSGYVDTMAHNANYGNPDKLSFV